MPERVFEAGVERIRRCCEHSGKPRSACRLMAASRALSGPSGSRSLTPSTGNMAMPFRRFVEPCFAEDRASTFVMALVTSSGGLVRTCQLAT
jgi:hypothetical protein